MKPINLPAIRVGLASAPASNAKDPVPLTEQEIHAFPGIGESIDELINFFESNDCAPKAYSDIGAVLIELFAASEEAEDLTGNEAKAEALFDVLANEADLLRLNAQSADPQPAKVVVKVKGCFALLKALAAANADAPLHTALIRSDGTQRPLPIPDIAEMSGVRRRASDTMEINTKIKGLVRGDEEDQNEFIIEGDTHIRLTGKSPHLWTEIRTNLDSSHWLVGTLVRSSSNQKWAVTDDTRVVAQSEMNLAERSD